MNRNTVLAIGLSAIVILVFQFFFAPKQAPQTQSQTPATETVEKAPAEAADAAPAETF